MPILTTHALAGTALALRRLWLRTVDTESLQGSDRHMLSWCLDNQRRAYAYFHISLGDDVDANAILAEVVGNIEADLRDPRSSFRRDVDWDTQRFVWRDALTVEDVVEAVEDDDAFFRVEDPPRQRAVVVRVHRTRGMVAVLFDHTVWDGVRIVNECVTRILRNQPFGSRWLAKVSYLPVRDEILQLYTAWAMGFRRLTHDPLVTFRHEHQQQVHQHHLRTADVKQLKNRAGSSFSAAIIALFAEMLFDWMLSDRDRLRFGIIVGCEDPRYRNNYSVLSLDVHRDDPIEDKVRSVARQMKRRALEVFALHQLVGSFEVETLFKHQMLDCLFSPGFFDRGDGLSLQVQDMGFFNVPASMPLYSFALSLDDLITMSTTLNTPEVCPQRMAAAANAVYAYGEDRVLRRVDSRPMAEKKDHP